ncbi:4-(cytidine 5'-diphospho)-2-C-methyl-D-erythritol kinase [Hyphococcus luteus]|uniref:4-diphosphocytidyl-2-C-methyl-D-erythritol kinase n=1 Tax=Hyphococcus luteus TaxID=2058213 RepID=A0A2S7K5N2_9PROT|nr:4-(cytidine 5'-diphospho)-2-C-methyl-D-erythritol kinase [Marinicaulis flavus]PQA87817.1 4-(cytidine 5'-diphospho)-2-C-methyl-D-erythritol kinase [Marinicaulis flavus]
MIAETAPAKVNLYLHIGPVRRDGLHDLASLFIFAEDGDVIRVEPANDISLAIEGPFADALKNLPPEANLVFRAAQKLARKCGVETGAAITLEKNLPVAAGVGGGSADAAAVLRALVKLWSLEIGEAALSRLGFSLGADVPACLARAPVHVTGAGEILEKGPVLPALWICLVNPGVDMPTGPVFRAFDAGVPAPATPVCDPFRAVNYTQVKAAMARTRNDLEAFAIERAPVIRDAIDALAQAPGALAARMSGSGATCFALFPSREGAVRAAAALQARGWWAMASALHVR